MLNNKAEETTETYYGLLCEDFSDDVFYGLEKIQDGHSAHTAAFKVPFALEAAEQLPKKLIPFIMSKLYACDSDGKPATTQRNADG
jgi:hypothetical protein